MSDNIKLAILTVPRILCILVAGYMAINKLDYWGWFLVAAIILTMIPLLYGDSND